jgi:hypothetical protein
VSAEEEGVEGNARMTALLGAILLIAFVAEMVTVLSVNQLFTWHVFIFSVGLILGVASLGWTGAWNHREKHRDGASPSAVVRPDLVEDDDALR